MRVDGTLSSGSTQSSEQLTGYSEATIDFDAESDVDDQELDLYAYSSSEDGSGERLEEELFRVTVGFVFGAPVLVDFGLRISSNVWGDSSPNAPGVWAATGIADFRHTATWAGVLDLRDAQGEPVEDFDVTSASGTDYRGPIAVPEPGRALLLLTGAGALLARGVAGRRAARCPGGGAGPGAGRRG
jgi:hypothetical protein